MSASEQGKSTVGTAGAGATPGAARATGRVRVDIGALTDIGKMREANEDAFLVCRMGRFLERMNSNLPESVVAERSEESGYLMLVADGMGGMAGGKVASHTAIATTVRLILEAPRWALRLDDPETRETEIEDMWQRGRAYVAKVHAAIRRQAAADPSLAGMGTTFTGAYTVGRDVFVIHIGDSRAYLCSDGRVIKITRDHTLAQSYLDQGLLSQGDPLTARLRHVLSQAIGGTVEDPEADMHALRINHGDHILLCTDGLTNLVDEEEMAEVLSQSASSNDACRTLVDLALEYGGADNITVIVASFAFEESGC